jgi:hypothetical protein
MKEKDKEAGQEARVDEEEADSHFDDDPDCAPKSHAHRYRHGAGLVSSNASLGALLPREEFSRTQPTCK